LSGEVVNSGRKLGVLVRKSLDLKSHVVPGNFQIVVSSLERREFSSRSIELVGQLSNIRLKIDNKIVQLDTSSIQVSNLVVSISKSGF